MRQRPGRRKWWPAVSRRSAYLILLGVAWVAYGLAVHDAPQQASLPAYASVPIAWQGWAWIASGALAIASTIIRLLPRWAGFAAASLMPILWCLGFAAWWLTGGHQPGAWQGAILWGALAVLAIIAAGDEDVRGRSC